MSATIIKPDIQIILCSGYSEIINREKTRDMGVAEYLEKPVIIDTLLKTIRQVLDR
ncbi:MAG: response regulator [Desulfobulbaceae bacterium]|nr:response regulator [Desulfobulbaceae bacterium]